MDNRLSGRSNNYVTGWSCLLGHGSWEIHIGWLYVKVGLATWKKIYRSMMSRGRTAEEPMRVIMLGHQWLRSGCRESRWMGERSGEIPIGRLCVKVGLASNNDLRSCLLGHQWLRSSNKYCWLTAYFDARPLIEHRLAHVSNEAGHCVDERLIPTVLHDDIATWLLAAATPHAC
jgi:hypothetical protein